MKALGYLIRAQLVNWLKGLLKKPGLLVLYIICFGFVVFSIAQAGGGAGYAFALPDGVLPAALVVLFTGLTYINLRGAMTRGTTVFGIEDITFLFTAPIRSQTVLIYGVIRQTAASLVILFVLIFQIGTLRNVFGLSAGGIAGLFIAWFLLAVISQVTALCLYALLAARPSGRSRAAAILNVAIVCIVLLFGALLATNPTVENALQIASNPAWRAIPLSGWMAGAVLCANAGQYLYMVLLILASLALGAAIFIVVWKKDPDYYEDLLDITQETHERKLAAKSPSGQANSMTRRRVKTGRSGLTRGHGASAFFFKQMREQRREGYLFLDMRTLMLVLVSAITCMPILGASGGDDLGRAIAQYSVLAVVLYTQIIFNTTMGRYSQEQMKMWLYISPASPRGKIFMCNLIPAIKGTLDGLICCVGASVALSLNVFEGIAGGLLLGVSTMFCVTGSLVADWLIGERHSRVLNMLIYFFCVFLLLVPGIVIFVLLVIANLPLLAYLGAAVYLAGITALLIALLGGVLHNAETNAQ